MLTRLYIDNFRCFEKFEWKPGRKQLILGRNGTGKTSLIGALYFLCQIAVDQRRVDDLFKPALRTAWLDQPIQVIEIEASRAEGRFVYRLEVEAEGADHRSIIRSEKVHLDGRPIFVYENGEVLSTASGSGGAFKLDQRRSALSMLTTHSGSLELLAFKSWLRRLRCFQINPFKIDGRADSEQADPDVNLENMASWYRHLAGLSPAATEAFLADLRECFDGFGGLVFEGAKPDVQALYADFASRGNRAHINFDDLSEGQKCLVCLYAITHFVVANGGTVIIDEPDNFISLREIQPWLMGIEEMADDHDGQVILISHHPEILNQWAGPYGVQFVRDAAGPVRVEKFKGDPESPLSAAELVARGWDLE